jgi:hypothetical protein
VLGLLADGKALQLKCVRAFRRRGGQGERIKMKKSKKSADFADFMQEKA